MTTSGSFCLISKQSWQATPTRSSSHFFDRRCRRLPPNQLRRSNSISAIALSSREAKSPVVDYGSDGELGALKRQRSHGCAHPSHFRLRWIAVDALQILQRRPRGLNSNQRPELSRPCATRVQFRLEFHPSQTSPQLPVLSFVRRSFEVWRLSLVAASARN